MYISYFTIVLFQLKYFVAYVFVSDLSKKKIVSRQIISNKIYVKSKNIN